MPKPKKPGRAYRPRQSDYPTLIDIGRVFRPVMTVFNQLREGAVFSAKGVPIFKDWTGEWCEIVPALEGWCDCWERIANGEGFDLDLSPARKLSKRLKFDVPLQPEEVDAAYSVMARCQGLMLRVTRARLAGYMRTEQIQIEMDRLGVSNVA